MDQCDVSGYHYIVYTDGGCIRNPSGAGACANVIIDTQTGEIKEIVNGYQSTTNNRMEIRAIIQALCTLPDGVDVHVYSDSQYAINCAVGVWSKKKNVDLWEKFDCAVGNKRVDFTWVKGHNNDPLNERCDSLCTQEMSKSGLLIDDGFEAEFDLQPGVAPERGCADVSQPGGAMAVSILPIDGIDMFFDQGRSARRAKEPCQRAIKNINNMPRPSFKMFMNLKVGGLDAWSSASADELKSLCGDATYQYIASFFKDESHQISAAKWYTRGLSIDKAIRKELVTIEVQKNAAKW